jgi:hypothetical protein
MATKRHHSRTSRCSCGCWWGALPNIIAPTKIFVSSRNNFFYTVILTCPFMWLCEQYVQSFFFAHLFCHHVNCCREPIWLSMWDELINHITLLQWGQLRDNKNTSTLISNAIFARGVWWVALEMLKDGVGFLPEVKWEPIRWT